MPANLESAGISTPNVFVNLSFMIASILLACFLFGCMMACKSCFQEKLAKHADKVKKKMLWNGVIRSVSLAYMNLGISTHIKVKDMMRSPETADTMSIVIIVIMFALLIGYIIFPLWFMVKYRQLLDMQEMRDKYELWYDGINIDATGRIKWRILYYPFFILKRFVYVMTPVILAGHPC